MNKLLELAKTKLGCGYVWAAEGQLLTTELLDTFIREFGIEHYNLSDGTKASKWIGKHVYDCSGLVQSCLFELGYMAEDEKQSAEEFFTEYCNPITKSELQPGDLVFIKTIYGDIDHIGIYSGNGQTVESRGTVYGVVQGDVSRFNVYGRLKFTGLDVVNLDWKQIIEKVSSNPTDWENAITVAVNAAKADGNLGALEIFQFLPQLIEKTYNSTK